MLICDKCGTAAEKGKFCKGCGGPLREFFSVKQTGKSSVVLTCTKCGKESSDGKFCIFCGGELIAGRPQAVSAPAENAPASSAENKAEGLVCKNCGKEFEKGKFCTVCGGPLVSKSEAEKPAEQQSAPVPAPAPAPSPVPTPVNVPTPTNSAENKASGLVCSKCGKAFEKGKFCTVCGGDLVPADGANKQQSAPVPTPAPSPVPTPVNVPTPTNSAENKASGLVCSKCGKAFEKGKFCTVCGGDLVPADGANNQQSAPVPTPAPSPVPTPVNVPTPTNSAENKASGLVCSKCGKAFEKGKFCTVCGGDLVPADSANKQQNAPAPSFAQTNAPEPAPAMASAAASVSQAGSSFGQSVKNAANNSPAPTPAQPSAAPSSSGKLVCEGCGKEFEKGKFCTVCGGNLIPAGGSAPAPQAAPPVAPAPVGSPSQGGSLRCTSCGNVMSKGKFCTVCGGSLVPIDGAPAPAPASQGLHCPQCGKTFTQGKFCTVCGIALVN